MKNSKTVTGKERLQQVKNFLRDKPNHLVRRNFGVPGTVALVFWGWEIVLKEDGWYWSDTTGG